MESIRGSWAVVLLLRMDVDRGWRPDKDTIAALSGEIKRGMTLFDVSAAANRFEMRGPEPRLSPNPSATSKFNLQKNSIRRSSSLHLFPCCSVSIGFGKQVLAPKTHERGEHEISDLGCARNKAMFKS